MNRPAFGGGTWTAVVDRIAQQVENPAKGLLANGNGQRAAGIDTVDTAAQAVGGAQGNRTDAPAAKMLLHFADQPQVVGRTVGVRRSLLRLDASGCLRVDNDRIING